MSKNSRFSSFNKILNLIFEKSPLQKKKIEKFLAEQNEAYFTSAEQFVKDYSGYLESQNIPLEYAVDAYLKMCSDMLKSQIYFMKTSKYPMENAKHAFDVVYNNSKEMKPYMIGLAISQFLWPTHYQMYKCLLKTLAQEKENIKSYLEIGPGHGLFLKDAIQILGQSAEFTAIDISRISIAITKSIINFLCNEIRNIEYIVNDITEVDISKKYDFITMGEVLEHVNYPDKLLAKYRDLLSDNGKGFISTCVDCPTIDHIYHFKSVNQIRDMVNGCGLLIEDERVLPVEDLPMEDIIRKKITINYCAIVKEA